MAQIEVRRVVRYGCGVILCVVDFRLTDADRVSIHERRERVVQKMILLQARV